MKPERKEFWDASSYAVVGRSTKQNFPVVTFSALKELGRTVYPIDPEVDTIDGTKAYKDFSSLPAKVERAILELPAEDTAVWIEKAAAAGIKQVWIHHGTETADALTKANQLGVNVLTGTCAVMYLLPKKFPHCVHRWIKSLAIDY